MNNSRVTFKEGFIMIDRHILDRRPVKRLKKNSKRGRAQTNLLVYLVAMIILSDCEDGIGYDTTVDKIAAECGARPETIWKIIDNKELFVRNLNDNTFQLRYLCKVEVSRGEKVVSAQTSRGHSLTRQQTVDDTPIYARAKSRDRDKEVKNTATAVQETADAAADFDFKEIIHTLFQDDAWRQLMERRHHIAIETDSALRELVMRAFMDAVEEKCMWQNGEPYNECAVKKYFANWIREGEKPRARLDKMLQDTYYSTKAADSEETPPPPDINKLLEEIDEQGIRRGPHGEPVDKLAPPCPSMDYIYDKKKHQWRTYHD